MDTTQSDSTAEEQVEHEATRDYNGDDEVAADADVTRRDVGVRLRTNVQAGSASERVNVTAEVHARDMPELIDKLPAYREVLYEQLTEARRQAKEVNAE